MIRRVVDWLCRMLGCANADPGPLPMERERQRRVDATITDAERAIRRARDARLEAQATVMEGRRRIDSHRRP